MMIIFLKTAPKKYLHLPPLFYFVFDKINAAFFKFFFIEDLFTSP